MYFALYTEILGPHDDLGSVSSAAVSTAGTVCDGSAGNFPNTEICKNRRPDLEQMTVEVQLVEQ